MAGGRALADQAHPGWVWARNGWALCQLATWLPRGTHLPETYSSAGVVLERGALPLPRWVVLSEGAAWMVWGVAIAALCALLAGRFARVWIVLALVGLWTLNFHEGMNFKAYDRLQFWQGVVLLFAPGGGTGVVGNPGARFAMVLVYCGIYGSTGWMKLLVEPDWWSGDVLRYALADDQFALRPLGVLLAGAPWALVGLAVWTLAFECLFPALVWWGRARPWLLAAGAAMHLGIFATMHVNTFSFVAVSMYPVLLDAEQWGRVRAALDRAWVRGALGVAAAVGVGAALIPMVVTAWIAGGPPAPWTLPDPVVRAALADDVTTLLALDPDDREGARARVRARLDEHGTPFVEADGLIRVDPPAGPAPRCYAAHLDRSPKDANDGPPAVALLLALADRRADATLVFYEQRLPAWPEGCVEGVIVDRVGRYRVGAGTQTWPAPWAWVLPWEGDFVGVAGPGNRPFAAALRARAPVRVYALPEVEGGLDAWRGHHGEVPPGSLLLTDTGPLRAAPSTAAPDPDVLTQLATALP